MNETYSHRFLNSLLTGHLGGHIGAGADLVDEHYDTAMTSYERQVLAIFESQQVIQRNAEEFYSGSIGKRPIFDISSMMMMAISMLVPAYRRNEAALALAEEVGAGDQVPNAHLAARLSALTGLTFPCLLAVTQFEEDGSMAEAHDLVVDSGSGKAALTMFGLGVVMALLSEGVEIEEEILALLSLPEDMA